MSPLGYESHTGIRWSTAIRTTPDLNRQEWFERHLEDRGGEVTELICALAPVAVHKRETAVGVHLAIATTFAAVLAALGLRQL